MMILKYKLTKKKEIELGFRTKKLLETLLRLRADYPLYIVKIELDILCN